MALALSSEKMDIESYKLVPLQEGGKLSAKPPKVILVDLWASWCEPCKATLPYYISLQKKYSEHVQFMGVSVDDDRADALQFLKENKFEFAAFHDKQKLLQKAHKVEAIPMFYILNSKLEIVATFRGSKPQHQKEIANKLVELLK